MKQWVKIKYKKFNNGKDNQIQQQDNTYVKTPTIMESIERTVNNKKWSELDPKQQFLVKNWEYLWITFRKRIRNCFSRV